VAAPLQLIDDGDEIERLAAVVERHHRLVEPGVALAVEILGAQEAGDLDDRVGVDQQRPQHGALRLQVGGDAFGRGLGRFNHLHRSVTLIRVRINCA
jgi:hypothetical protein